MFDHRALRPCGTQHRFRAVRVHHAAQPLRAGFAAGGVELRLRQRRRAAVANAGRRENLDEIGAVGLLPADILANLLDRPLRVRHRAERGEDARAGQLAARDRIAQRLIRGRAHTLHGGEARLQRDQRVLGAVAECLLRRLWAGVVAALGIEMPADVHVRVDEPRQQRQVREIVGDCADGIADAGDFAVLDRDGDIIRHASHIDQAPGANRDARVRLRHQRADDKRNNEGDECSDSVFVIRHLLFVISSS